MVEVTRDEFLQEIVCLESRVDKKVEKVSEIAEKLEVRQREVEKKVDLHLVLDENKKTDERLEDVAEKVMDPEHGIVATQTRLCESFQRFEKEINESNEDFDKKIEKLELQQKDTGYKLEKAIKQLEKRMYAGFGVLVGVYVLDKPEIVIKYLTSIAGIFVNAILTILP